MPIKIEDLLKIKNNNKNEEIDHIPKLEKKS